MKKILAFVGVATMLATVPAAYAAPKGSAHCIANSKKTPCAHNMKAPAKAVKKK